MRRGERGELVGSMLTQTIRIPYTLPSEIGSHIDSNQNKCSEELKALGDRTGAAHDEHTDRRKKYRRRSLRPLKKRHN